MSVLDQVADVEIDSGTFKYVYIRVYEDAGGDIRYLHSSHTLQKLKEDIYDFFYYLFTIYKSFGASALKKISKSWETI